MTCEGVIFGSGAKERRTLPIVVGEADDAIRGEIAENLRGEGFDVTCAESAETLFRAIAQHGATIVILGDLGPDPIRAETTRLLRLLSAAQGGLSVIALAPPGGGTAAPREDGTSGDEGVRVPRSDLASVVAGLIRQGGGVSPPLPLPGAGDLLRGLPGVAADQILDSIGRSFAALVLELRATDTEQGLRTVVHGIKGVMANLGGGPLLDLCLFVEGVHATESWPALRWTLPLLERECLVIQHAVETGSLAESLNLDRGRADP